MNAATKSENAIIDSAKKFAQAPKFDLLIDQSKYDYFMENFSKFILEDLEYLTERSRA